MNQNLLLPHGFKKIGWVIFVPALILGSAICFFNNYLITFFSEAATTNVAIIGTVAGAMMIGFSRERIEDELILKIRLDALLTAVWINYLLLIVASLVFYDLKFLTVMACNMAATLVIFLVVFYFKLWRLRKGASGEE